MTNQEAFDGVVKHRRVQRVHDGGETAWAHPEAALQLLAQEYELSTSVLDAIEAEGGFPQCS